MIIFNTTYKVADDLESDWLQWVRDTHIPFMLSTGFAQPQIMRIAESHDTHGTSYAVQFLIDNTESLENWKRDYMDAFHHYGREKFGDKFLYMCTALEIIS
jgi:antibiotic biosynthesis monooxygenase (ABM) superfamily enzyme